MCNAEFYGELRCCRTKSEQHRLYIQKTKATAVAAELPRGVSSVNQSLVRCNPTANHVTHIDACSGGAGLVEATTEGLCTYTRMICRYTANTLSRCVYNRRCSIIQVQREGTMGISIEKEYIREIETTKEKYSITHTYVNDCKCDGSPILARSAHPPKPANCRGSTSGPAVV